MAQYESVDKSRIYQSLIALQIKNDCETLIALQGLLAQPILALAFLPMYALFVEEMQKSIGKDGETFKIKNEWPFSISAIRSKLKLFGGERLGKNKKKVLKLDRLQDEIFRSKLRFRFTKGFNIHYNLGIFFTEEGRILGNTQYYYYMFQDRYVSGREYSKEEIREFTKSIGTVIGSVSKGLREFCPEHRINVEHKRYNLKFKDFNTNRKSFTSFSKITNGKDVSLMLLHILSNINFTRFILEEALDHDNTYLFKVKYISLFYSVRSIGKIIGFFERNSVYDKLYEPLKNIVETSDGLLNSKLRNCMMHYSFEQDGKYIINDNYLDVDVNYYGLIETYFDGMNYRELNSVITEKLYLLSDCLESLLNIDNEKLRDL